MADAPDGQGSRPPTSCTGTRGRHRERAFPPQSLRAEAVGPRGIQTEPEAGPPDNWLLFLSLPEPRPLAGSLGPAADVCTAHRAWEALTGCAGLETRMRTSRPWLRSPARAPRTRRRIDDVIGAPPGRRRRIWKLCALRGYHGNCQNTSPASHSPTERSGISLRAVRWAWNLSG